MKSQGKTITDSLIRPFFKPYPKDAHKGDFGRVFIIAGSAGMTGAAVLAGLSALRSGAGLVTVGIPESLNDILEIKLTEAMTLPLPEGPKRSFGENALTPALDFASKCDVIALGPGLSLGEETRHFVKDFIQNCDKPMVIDADALSALATRPAILTNARGPKIITPHTGEMARLLSTDQKGIQRDRVGAAKKAVEKFGCIAVLKGAGTLVCNLDSIWVNTTGNPGMATGGSGDVLTGIITGFMARGMEPIEAALAGAYIHGLAGDLAAKEKGEISLIAGDIIEFLPTAIKRVLEI